MPATGANTVGTKRWFAYQLLKEFECWKFIPNMISGELVWDCPVCDKWRHIGTNGIPLLNHLHTHTEVDLKATWMTKTLSGV